MVWVGGCSRFAVSTYRLGRGDGLCRLCGTERETGDHIVLACGGTLALKGWDWYLCGEIDEKRRWQYRVDIVEKEVVKGQVKDFFLIYQIAEWFQQSISI